MKKPIVVVNFKTYAFGEAVVKMAKAIEKFDKNIIVGVQATDVHAVYSLTSLPVFIEHVDAIVPGRNTGFISPEAAYSVGAKGVFLNHSEHKLDFRVLRETVKRCREVGLTVLIFAGSLREAKKVKKLKPDYLVYEPPELVSGKVSVSSAKPGIIKKIAQELNYPFLVGAGVKTKVDVDLAIQFGAKGIAVSSAITKARDVKKALKKLLG